MTLEELLDMESIVEEKSEPEIVDPKLEMAIEDIHELSREAYQNIKRRTYKATCDAERFLRSFKCTTWGIRFTPISSSEFKKWRDNATMWLILEMSNINIVIHDFDTFELI